MKQDVEIGFLTASDKRGNYRLELRLTDYGTINARVTFATGYVGDPVTLYAACWPADELATTLLHEIRSIIKAHPALARARALHAFQWTLEPRDRGLTRANLAHAVCAGTALLRIYSARDILADAFQSDDFTVEISPHAKRGALVCVTLGASLKRETYEDRNFAIRMAAHAIGISHNDIRVL